MIWIFIYLFFMALIFAFVEIQVEGKHGWAWKLPTWYKRSGYSRVYSFFNSGRPLTGYHLFMGILVLLFFHYVFFYSAWTIWAECIVIANMTLFLITEDFLWFVFNEKYTIKNFKSHKIWWHNNKKWVFGLFPIDYFYSIFFAGTLYYIVSFVSNQMQIFYDFIWGIVIILALVAISVLLSSHYIRWHNGMLLIDERKLIFKRR